jgi:hypothetical protein
MALITEPMPPPVMHLGPLRRTSTDRLRIGLLVTAPKASQDELALAQWTRRQPGLEMAGLIIQGTNHTHGTQVTNGTQAIKGENRLAAMGLSFLIRLESLALRRHPRFHHHTARIEPSDLGATTGALNDCDLLICLDPTVSPVDLSVLAKRTHQGLLALRTGLGHERSSEPAGFWEVALQRDVTTFTIEHIPGATQSVELKLREPLKPGEPLAGANQVLFRGAFATRFYFLLNQATLRAQANAAVQRLLGQGSKRFESGQHLWANAPPLGFGPDFGPEQGFPDLPAQLRYGRSLLATLWKKWRNKYVLKNNYRWGVAFRPGGWQNLVMHKAQTIPNSPGRFLADPFVLSDQQRSYCFVEDYNYREAKACISVYELHANGSTRIGPVIREPFHLSFPFLFQYQSRHYLCPESSASGEIRLYECIALPDQWVFTKTLMCNIAAADTMLFQHEGLWWLLTNIDSAGIGDYCSELHVFYASEPITDEWTPHPQNPVIVDPNRARNGGLLFKGAEIYRVSQRQGFDAYGQSAAINRITALTPSTYQEEVVATIEPDFFPKTKGTHHLHSNGRFTVFDYQY